MFLRLAKELNNTNSKFIMVGRPEKSKYQKELFKKIKKVPNLKYYGETSYENVNKLLSKATVFVNTSLPREGFANTFIQSWMLKTPIVALSVDPDNTNVKEKIGFHSKNFNQLVKDVKLLITSENICKDMGKRAQAYANLTHDLSITSKKHLEIFEKLILD